MLSNIMVGPLAGFQICRFVSRVFGFGWMLRLMAIFTLGEPGYSAVGDLYVVSWSHVIGLLVKAGVPGGDIFDLYGEYSYSCFLRLIKNFLSDYG
jgi:hypothetical protein